LYKRKILWKNGFIVLLFINFYNSLFSKEYSGYISKNTVWQDKVIVKGDVIVKKDVTLTVLPGTIVYFLNDESSSFNLNKKVKDIEINFGFGKRATLIIEGKIRAEGDNRSNIEFRKFPAKTEKYYWGGIIVKKDGIFRHVIISDALTGIVGMEDANVNLELSKISHCGIGVMILDRAKTYISGSVVSNNSTSGIELYGESILKVNSTVLKNNLGKAIFLNDFSTVDLEDSRIIGNKVGVSVYDLGKIKMQNNIFKDNEVTSIGLSTEKPQGNYTWKGIVKLNHDIVIPQGKTLIVEPGTVVYFSSRSVKDISVSKLSGGETVDISFRGLVDVVIKGNMWAAGNEKNPIVFAGEGSGYWGGLIFMGKNVKSKLKNVIIKGARVAIYTWGNSTPLIENTKIVDNYMGIVACENSSPILKFCKIEDNVYGVASYDYAAPSLRQSFLGSSEKIGVGTRGSSSPYLFRNEIKENEIGVGVFEHSSPKIEKNSIEKNKYGIIALDESSPSIFENMIRGSEKIGIKLSDYVKAFLVKNKFVSNKLALKYEITSNISMAENFFKNNKKDSLVHGGGRGATLSGILKQNELWQGEINLKGDVIVPSGVTLYITEGTLLYFPEVTDYDIDIARIISGEKKIVSHPGICDLIIEGKVIINDARVGMKKEYVKGKVSWGGIIVFGEADINKFRIENAKVGISVFGKGVANLKDIKIIDSDKGLFLAENSKLNSENLVIIKNVIGVDLKDKSVVNLKKGIISQNRRGIISSDNSFLNVSNTLFTKNGKAVLVKDESIAIIERNVFARNSMALEILTIKMPELKENKFEENVKDSNFPNLFK